MPTRLGAVPESNSGPETLLNGTLASGSLAGLTVIGVNFAGRQSGNVGTFFSGIYGSLQVNADGTFTYRLDNTDTDTDLLSNGEQALERFVVTYRLGGTIRTVDVEIAINGTDEPGQATSNLVDSIEVLGNFVVGRDEHIRFVADAGFRQGIYNGPDFDPRWDFTNYGSIGIVSDGSRRQVYAVGPVPPAGRVYNFGRITATSDGATVSDISAMLAFGENVGVLSAINYVPYRAGDIAGRAIAAEGLYRNSGLVEAVSSTDAYGIWAFGGGHFTNSGLIYVEGGAGYPSNASTDPLGIIGFRSGGTGNIVNTGTVRVVSNTGLVESVGFSYFPNSTNIYNPVWIDNSGTIVADRAIIALDGYQVSTYLINSGHIEGTLELDRGVNQIFNATRLRTH